MRDSILPRLLADAFVLRVDGVVTGFAGVWREHFPGRVMEFWLEPEAPARDRLFEALLVESRATELEAQSNVPVMKELLDRWGRGDTVVEHELFEDGGDAPPPALDGIDPEDVVLVPGSDRPDGPDATWLVTIREEVVAWGGALDHYNPPFVDLYMEVAPAWRRRGLGAYLVHELRGMAIRESKTPAARCSPDNPASRATLIRGGMRRCGQLEVRRVAPVA